MSEHFDAIVMGLGPGGEVVAGRLLDAGKHIAVIERELIGGECAYWGCIPSKTLLRPPDARNAAERAAGTSRPEIDWPALRDYRDYMVRNLDDSSQADGYEKRGATVIRGTASLVGPGRVGVGGEVIEADDIIVATGSTPVRPTIEGLDLAEVWTNREATGLREIPDRAVVLGGGAVGTELGQFLARMGCTVTILQRADRLLDREDPRVGEIVGELFRAEGIDLRFGRQMQRVIRSGATTTVELDDGSQIETDVIVLGTGRRPNSEGLGLENVGVTLPERGGIPIDEHCRVADGLWAAGDVTGTALFTHVAMYQGRVIADNILGGHRVATYGGIPRVVFADPEVAAVGITAEQAAKDGLDVAFAEVDLAETLARPWTYEQNPFGKLGILADRNRQVLVGAWAVAPLAGEWIHQAALAIRAEIPLKVLLDQIAQFPTYSEGYLKALEALQL